MKKIILTMALFATVLVAGAQEHQHISKPKKATVKPDTSKTPALVYHFDLNPGDTEILLGSAANGFTPYLHTTPTPMSNEQQANVYFSKMYEKLIESVKQQKKVYDSLYVKKDTSKKATH